MTNQTECLNLLLNSGYIDWDEDHTDQLWFNQNDTWAWALAYGRIIILDEVIEVARLFRAYGYCGLLYWETLHPNGFQKSEFMDINRSIQFVREEEKIFREHPDSNKRAYIKAHYLITNAEL